MKQVQFGYKSAKQLLKLQDSIARFRGNRPTKILFQVHSARSESKQLDEVYKAIAELFPTAICVGSSSNGSVVAGKVSSDDIAISCTIFERDTTQIEVLQYVVSEESIQGVAEDLVREVNTRPWVKGVGILVASWGVSLTNFCNALENLRIDVQVFGGMAGSTSDVNPAYVYSGTCGYSENSAVFVLYGGEDFFVETTKIAGWKPLGKNLLVTKAVKNVLCELEGSPAFEAYSKYLNIQNDSFFFQNTLEFPLFYYENGEICLRSPMACSDEGALLLASDIETGAVVRIAYGDPQSIMESVRQGTIRVSNFCPEGIQMYSSMARLSFWGDADVGKETEPFQSIAPTFGFYASGEFMRAQSFVGLYNACIVVAAMREGEPNHSLQKCAVVGDGTRAGKVSIISRLANFTNVSSAELMEMYNKLTKTSITDALSELYNRGEIQRRIAERYLEFPGEKMSLVMIDIDDFKSVNDTYGHKEGDNVIQGLSKQIQLATFTNAPDADAGRWGGEEFMIMLPDMGANEAAFFAETVRAGFAQINFPAVGYKTISLGVTDLRSGDTVNKICSRVDEALYEAKRTGKNKVVIL
ncbi:MAG: GGDEF domain-containing protein [Fibrobacter sp.]|nr:GGDEF domain-containing protein [Fibrobacter sp.]